MIKQKSEVRMTDTDADLEAGPKPGVRRSLSRARVQLTHAVSEARDVLEARLSGAPKPGDAAFGRMRDLLQRDRENVARQSTPTSPTGPQAAVAVSAPAVQQPPARSTQTPVIAAPPPPPRPTANTAPADSTTTAAKLRSAPPPPPARKQITTPDAGATITQRGVPVRDGMDQSELLGAAPISQLMAAPSSAVTAPVVAPAAAPTPPANPAPAVSASTSSEEPAGSDPIRTLTMARLLAVQGYRKRALSIYDELLARDANDPSLRAEADRLRN